MARPLRAQITSTWSGLGTNNAWTTPTNWQNNAAPISSVNTAIILTGSTQTQTTQNIGGFALNSLTFASEAGPFTINQTGSEFFSFQPTSGNAAPHIDQFSASNHAINFGNTGFILNANLLLGGSGSGSLSITGQLQGAGRLVLNGPYTLTLNPGLASNTQSGTNLNAGTLRIATDTVLGNGNLEFGGGTLQLANNLNLTHPIVINGPSGAIDANGFLANMANTALTVTGPGRLILTSSSGAGVTTIAGQLQQTGGLSVSGANHSVTLSGGNSYTGLTTISNGATLNIDIDSRLGNAANGISLDTGGTLRINGGGFNSNRSLLLNGSGGAIDVANFFGINGLVNGTGPLTKTGAGRLALLQPNTYTGTTTVNEGRLDISHNQAVQNSTVLLNGGTLGFSSLSNAPVLGGLGGSSGIIFTGALASFSVGNNNASTTYSGSLSGVLSNGLNKVGNGVWTLLGSNILTGSFNIQSGVVVAGSSGALSPNAPITLSPGAVLDLNGFNYAPISGTSNFGGAVQMRFGSIVVPTGVTAAYNGATVSNGFLSGGGQHIFNGTNTFNNVTTFNGTQLVQSGTLNLTNSTIGGALSVGGTLNWTNGTLSSSGNLTVGNTASFSGITSNGRLNVSGGVNTGTLNITAAALVLGGGSTTFVGSVSESGGTINLNGQSIDLRGGLLVNNGTITNGTTNVGFGALAKGAGTYGAVNVSDGGKFSPGNSPGAVTTASTTWNSGGSYVVEIADALAGAGVGWDEWNVNGVLDVHATNSTNDRFTISLSSMEALAANFDAHRDYDWVILHTTGGIGTFDPSAISLDASAFKNDLLGGRFSLNSSANDLIIHFSAVPEPIFMTFFAVSGILSVNRRRFHRQLTSLAGG